MNKRTALWISLCVIVLYWIYQVATAQRSPTIPDQFSTLVMTVALNKAAVTGVILLLLWLGDERLDSLGLRREAWPRHAALGIAFGLAMFIALNVLLSSVLQSFIPPRPHTGKSIFDFFKAPANLFVWLPIGVIGGGFVEELERIFILTRFEKWLGRPGLALGFVLSSVMFGQAHLYQGLGNAISIVVSGAVFALLYLRKRSALEPMAAHAFSDILAMVAATFVARAHQ